MMAEPPSSQLSPIINNLPTQSFPPFIPASLSDVPVSFGIHEGLTVEDSRRAGLDLVRRYRPLSAEVIECRERLQKAESDLQRAKQMREEASKRAQKDTSRVKMEDEELGGVQRDSNGGEARGDPSMHDDNVSMIPADFVSALHL
jgi:hypothetical protein